jgi:RNA polymerase sigma factor for flagellar operon FliA
MPPRPTVHLSSSSVSSADAITQIERKELKAHLAGAIEELPERQRHILVLSYQEELTLAEIGDVFGVCESRVRQLRSLAITRLRTLMRRSLGATEARPQAAA